MNLVLLDPEDFLADGTVRLTGRRLRHVRDLLRASVGDTLRVGRARGAIGLARVASATDDEIVLAAPTLDAPPPARAGIDLVLALPRPKALRRVLPAAASLGIDRVVLLNAARVEKSYFASRVLDPASIDSLLRLGLEQACDTVPPEVLVRPRFRPFVEDEIHALTPPGTLRLVAHPAAAERLPARGDAARVAIAIGPEGGWVPFEIGLLRSKGFRAVTLGPRVLRVETAVATLVGALRG